MRALVKKELGISHVEYWNRPFGGKHTNKKYVGELVKRTRGEGIKNVLILVDEKHELDHASKTELRFTGMIQFVFFIHQN